jgi:hypothetical protein
MTPLLIHKGSRPYPQPQILGIRKLLQLHILPFLKVFERQMRAHCKMTLSYARNGRINHVNISHLPTSLFLPLFAVMTQRRGISPLPPFSLSSLVFITSLKPSCNCTATLCFLILAFVVLLLLLTPFIYSPYDSRSPLPPRLLPLPLFSPFLDAPPIRVCNPRPLLPVS